MHSAFWSTSKLIKTCYCQLLKKRPKRDFPKLFSSPSKKFIPAHSHLFDSFISLELIMLPEVRPLNKPPFTACPRTRKAVSSAPSDPFSS